MFFSGASQYNSFSCSYNRQILNCLFHQINILYHIAGHGKVYSCKMPVGLCLISLDLFYCCTSKKNKLCYFYTPHILFFISTKFLNFCFQGSCFKILYKNELTRLFLKNTQESLFKKTAKTFVTCQLNFSTKLQDVEVLREQRSQQGSYF